MRLNAVVQDGLSTGGARAPFSRREKGRDEGFTPKSLSAVPSSGALRHLLPKGRRGAAISAAPPITAAVRSGAPPIDDIARRLRGYGDVPLNPF